MLFNKSTFTGKHVCYCSLYMYHCVWLMAIFLDGLKMCVSGYVEFPIGTVCLLFILFYMGDIKKQNAIML